MNDQQNVSTIMSLTYKLKEINVRTKNVVRQENFDSYEKLLQVASVWLDLPKSENNIIEVWDTKNNVLIEEI